MRFAADDTPAALVTAFDALRQAVSAVVEDADADS